MKADPLDLPLRKRITEYIRRNPGVHFRQISRDLDLAIGQLDFHLNMLIKNEVLVRQVDAGNTRFYVRDRFSKDERKAMSMLRREIPRGIVLFLLEKPGSTPTKILDNFSFTSATMSYHLRRLERTGILRAEQDGRERHYFIDDPELVRSLMVLYKSTLLDTIVDKVY
ncbi:MAG: transcriptional regulator [Candidatus Thermoplasmatota archaeon]|nr:transcriptional regulator [Candidatus Thermoplasmatota archaeon]